MDRLETGAPDGGQIVPALKVRESDERVRVTIPRHGHATEPVVELVREGDVVRAIDITCSCGQRFRLLCDYGTTPAA